MRTSGVVLCAVPSQCWNSRPLDDLNLELMRRFLSGLPALERRLLKAVQEDEESFRYSRLCEHIEQIAISHAKFAPNAWRFRSALQTGHFPCIRIGHDYLDLIQVRHRTVNPKYDWTAARIGASVISPQQLRGHADAFAAAAEEHALSEHQPIRHRLWFIKNRLLPNDCGLVEFVDVFGFDGDAKTDDLWHPTDGRTIWERLRGVYTASSEPAHSSEVILKNTPSTTYRAHDSQDWKKYGQGDRGDYMHQRLEGQVKSAINGGVIELSKQRHNMLTNTLQRFIHKNSQEKPIEAPMTYNDGEQTLPFPLYCLDPLPAGWAPTRELHIGLVSMRHLPIDQYIDINWYRNVDVPSREGLARADRFCHEHSLRELNHLLELHRGERLLVNLYHSGYVPAVVGFYRAFVMTLSTGEFPVGAMRVVPKLQPNERGGFQEGRFWPE